MFFTKRQGGIFLAIAATILIGLTLHARWTAEAVIERNTLAFLSALEDSRWSRVETLLDPSYADRWGFNRERALREMREMRRHFFVLEIQPTILSVAPETGSCTLSIRLDGTGSPIAELVKEHVNALRTPFSFIWKKGSWKPWDWRLAAIQHDALRLPEE